MLQVVRTPNDLGATPSAGLVVCARQRLARLMMVRMTAEKKLPFEPRIPDAKTVAAMKLSPISKRP
jgi:hypothetical protein